jgi:CRP/FNR family transcriptional regulator
MRQQSIFADLRPERLRNIPFRPLVTHYKAGEVIYAQGDKANALFTVRSGIVKISKSLADGRSHILYLETTGALLGWDSFLEERHTQSAIAVSDCELCHLPEPDLNRLRRNDNELDTAILRRWVTSLRRAESRMLDLSTRKGTEKLATLLLEWCADAPPGTWVELPLTRGELGEMLGLTVETISRFLADWRKRGLISEQHHQIRIDDREALIDIARGNNRKAGTS